MRKLFILLAFMLAACGADNGGSEMNIDSTLEVSTEHADIYKQAGLDVPKAYMQTLANEFNDVIYPTLSSYYPRHVDYANIVLYSDTSKSFCGYSEGITAYVNLECNGAEHTVAHEFAHIIGHGNNRPAYIEEGMAAYSEYLVYGNDVEWERYQPSGNDITQWVDGDGSYQDYIDAYYYYSENIANG